MNFYHFTVPQLIRTLGQVHHWLDKAQKYAEQKKFDVNVLLTARLAPDQFHFTRQVQVITDNAKGTAARLAGVQAPVFEDTEKTVEELRARIDKTIAFLKTLTPEQFQGAAERTITLPFLPGQGLKGSDYLVAFALPNFYFHATTAYSILRHNGVDVGKGDFLGEVPFFALPPSP
ncbi:DUF1993 domain-containing protein [Archangium lipolyticum]|uniref:DUF1993 domain-containing protein n=1 Tax=Archangium lipolyticum TaxID=2970465 RepID=UPI002149A14C|nr:DUF1993 domain-containing protein [Archangium lipolyticum]